MGIFTPSCPMGGTSCARASRAITSKMPFKFKSIDGPDKPRYDKAVGSSTFAGIIRAIVAHAGPGVRMMAERLAAVATHLAARFALALVLMVAAVPAGAAVFDEHDTARLAAINEAIQAFEDDVGSALHNLSSEDAGLIESYAYVELNLEAAHERLNTIFMMVAVSIYMDSAADEFLVLEILHGQLLPRSKNYLAVKSDAVASMAAAHPQNKVFAEYTARAGALLGQRAIVLLDELYGRIGALRRPSGQTAVCP